MASADAPAAGVLRVERLAGDDLIKEVLADGSGACPQLGDEVHAHYTGRLASDGSVFDSSVSRGTPFSFTLGRGEVIKAWDEGFATMRRGERAVLQCAPSYGYGARGSPPKIPPNSTLRFEVELLSFGPKPKDLTEMSLAEKLAEAAARKEAGNAAFAGGDVHTALGEWERGVDALKAGLNDVNLATGQAAESFDEPLAAPQLEQLRALRCSLPANRCMAELKLGRFADAAKSASEALAADPAHSKSLFRRGVARAALGELGDAKADLVAAGKLAPADAAIRAELEKVTKALAAVKAKEKAIFGGWASKKGGLFGGDEDDAQPALAGAGPIAYVTPPDAERCKKCRGWGKDLLRAECDGHCATCWAAANGSGEAAAAAPPAEAPAAAAAEASA
jgi:peptidylprolyl isomerase